MEPSRQARSDALKAEARRLGFSLVGITHPDPPTTFMVYERWLASGFHGEMAYLASQRARLHRSDPRLILPECRSILVLGIPYFAHHDEPEQSGFARNLSGQVASYAWGADYHDVLPGKLQALVAFIEARLGRPVPNRWYTDTGPLLERELAWRAGLGWIGKNTCLINPRQGSYFFLAEILLGIELEPDAPFPSDHCGSCTRCIEACPTGCILPGRTLDASRCISYLTIELKSSIPLDLRSQTGDWIFGCDICQQVCPWNQRFAPAEGEPAFAPRPGLARPNLVHEMALSPEGFRQKFINNPVKRTRRAGYLRNVAMALGGQGKKASAPDQAQAIRALSAALSDPEPLVRGHAAWALGEIGGNAAGQVLDQAAGQESDTGVFVEISRASQKIKQDGAL